MTTDAFSPELARARGWKGLGLPVTRFKGGYFTPKDSYDMIWSSILMILGTRIGTRIMLPEFGSALPELVHTEQNDQICAALARRYTEEAIRRWEPRVNILRVDTNIAEDTLQIIITFSVRGDSADATRSYGVVIKRQTSFEVLQTFFNA